MTFVLSSSALKSSQAFPIRHTCDGENVSPPLTWAHPPAHTKAFALVMDDPDAPGGTFTHWMLCDIPATRVDLDEGGEGAGTPGTNSFGKVGYGGPCPPRGHGRHRYRFHLIALTKPLGLQPGFSRQQLEAAMRHVVLGTATLVSSYERREPKAVSGAAR
jgi:Raf kinase inhibitor-like YbhB/YbcL family protein